MRSLILETAKGRDVDQICINLSVVLFKLDTLKSD